jgi:hypothetical protein
VRIPPQCGHVPGAGYRPATTSSNGTPANRDHVAQATQQSLDGPFLAGLRCRQRPGGVPFSAGSPGPRSPPQWCCFEVGAAGAQRDHAGSLYACDGGERVAGRSARPHRRAGRRSRCCRVERPRRRSGTTKGILGAPTVDAGNRLRDKQWLVTNTQASWQRLVVAPRFERSRCRQEIGIVPAPAP